MRNKFPFLNILFPALLFYSCHINEGSVCVCQSGNWIHRAKFNGILRSGACAFIIGDNVYICGGYASSTSVTLQDCWRYNVSTDSWAQEADMKGGARSSAIGFNIGNKGFVGIGFNGNQLLQDFWQYDPSTNTWTQRSQFPAGGRMEAVGFSILDKGYIATGTDMLSNFKDLWEYDTTRNSWIKRADLPGTQRSAAAFWVYRNKAYIVTGQNADSAVNDFWIFDPNVPDNESWRKLRSISNATAETFDDGYTNISRWNTASFIIQNTAVGDRGYITTGENHTLYTFTWEYDFATDLWRELTPLEAPARTGALGFSADNRGFIFGGRDDNKESFPEIFEFHPDEVVNSND